jgi:hypothetical protein
MLFEHLRIFQFSHLKINFRKEYEFLIAKHQVFSGIQQKLKDKLFTPKFTLKSKGQGLDLTILK